MLRRSNHVAESLSAESGRQLVREGQGLKVLAWTRSNDLLHLLERLCGLGVVCVHIARMYACDEDDLLTIRIEHHELVEEHEVHVEEVVALGMRVAQDGLGVLEVVVGEVADQTPAERWEPLELRRLVLGEHLP